MVRGLTIYQYLFHPLEISALDVLTWPWGHEGLRAGDVLLGWGYSLQLAQRQFDTTEAP
jgi:hypothetical protein